MAVFQDGAGLTYTAASQEAVDKYAHMIRGYLGMTRDVGDRLKDVLAADGEMPMAVAAKGYFFLLFATGAMTARARKAAEEMENLAARMSFTARENGHLRALQRACAGDLTGMTAALEEVLIAAPRDLLALRMAHHQHFYAGNTRQMRDSIARVLPRHDPEARDTNFVRGMYCFALEEFGDYAAAEPYGRAAVEANPADAWSVHAVAHVMEMQGRHRDGVAWVGDLESSWSKTHNFRYHLYWHRALFHLEMEEFDTVLDLYDRQVSRDLEMDQYLDVCNSASLLWRLEMFGVDVGARWRPVADIALRHIEDRELMFVQLHHHMALLSAGEDDAAARLADHVRQHAGRQYDQAEAAAKAAVPLVTAMTALRAGDYDAVVEAMWPARYDLPLIGGSHAQRDLFEEMLAWSAIRSRHHDLARNLLAERVAAKPHSAWGWKIYAAALNRAGDSLAAHRASDQAQRIVADYH